MILHCCIDMWELQAVEQLAPEVLATTQAGRRRPRETPAGIAVNLTYVILLSLLNKQLLYAYSILENFFSDMILQRR